MRLGRQRYNVSEINQYIKDIRELTVLRDRSLMLATTVDSDVTQQRYLEEVDSYTNVIDCALKALEFMLEAKH